MVSSWMLSGKKAYKRIPYRITGIASLLGMLHASYCVATLSSELMSKHFNRISHQLNGGEYSSSYLYFSHQSNSCFALRGYRQETIVAKHSLSQAKKQRGKKLPSVEQEVEREAQSDRRKGLSDDNEGIPGNPFSVLASLKTQLGPTSVAEGGFERRNIDGRDRDNGKTGVPPLGSNPFSSSFGSSGLSFGISKSSDEEKASAHASRISPSESFKIKRQGKTLKYGRANQALSTKQGNDKDDMQTKIRQGIQTEISKANGNRDITLHRNMGRSELSGMSKNVDTLGLENGKEDMRTNIQQGTLTEISKANGDRDITLHHNVGGLKHSGMSKNVDTLGLENEPLSSNAGGLGRQVLRGQEVLLALQRVSTKKGNAKKQKGRTMVGGRSETREANEDIDMHDVKPIVIRAEWTSKIETIERQIQELRLSSFL